MDIRYNLVGWGIEDVSRRKKKEDGKEISKRDGYTAK